MRYSQNKEQLNDNQDNDYLFDDIDNGKEDEYILDDDNSTDSGYITNLKSIATDNIMLDYFNKIKHFKVLSRLEEKELFEKYRQYDYLKNKEHLTKKETILYNESKNAKIKLINHNLRLVVNLGKRFLNKGVPFSDLIQEGNLGLITALEKFEYKKGFRFSTYAFFWIKQNINRYIINHASVRIPINRVEVRNKLRKILKEETKNDKLTVNEIMENKELIKKVSEKINLPLNKWIKIYYEDGFTLSLDTVFVNSYGEEENILSKLVSSSNIEKEIENKELSYIIITLFNQLIPDERNRYIIKSKLGIGAEKKTEKELSKELDLTIQRISAIYSENMRRVNRFFNANKEEYILYLSN